MCHTPFDAIDPGSNLPFGKLFFLPFQISNRIRKAFIFFIKIKEIIKKLKIKYRVGLG